MSTGARTLQFAAETFASQINYSITGALGIESDVLELRAAGEHVVVQSSDIQGIPLAVDGVIRYRLKVQAHCNWNDGRSFLAVHKSAYGVVVEGYSEPVVRFEYVRDARNHPVSHLNIHSFHPGLVDAMEVAGKGSRAVRGSPQTAHLHFPTGGHRFRPTIEDVLQFLIEEFAVDSSDDWRDFIVGGRSMFKEAQLRAAIQDHPAEAVRQLRDLGYAVEWVGGACEPNWREEKFSQY